MKRSIIVQTGQKLDVINVTAELADLISDIEDGLAVFYTPHTTAALIINEDDDELRADIAKAAESLLANLRPFQHARNSNPNAEAHIFSALAGTTLTIPIEDGRLDLGTWQNILFIELDGPKQREIRCKVI